MTSDLDPRPPQWLRAFGAISWLGFAALFAPPARADDEHEDDEEAQAFEIPESSFDSWVFSWGETRHSTQIRLDGALEIVIDDVDRACDLSDEQAAKLDVAGRGDIKRYFEEIETLRKKFLAVRKDRERINDVWKEIQPIQSQLTAGLHGEGSLLRKTLRRTLTPEQADRWKRVERERKEYRFRSRVEWVVAMLDNVMSLTDRQREDFTALLLRSTRPPRKSGSYDHYVILYQLSGLPEDTLKPLFDDEQWAILNLQFANSANIRDYLEREGWLVLDDGSIPPAREKPAEPTQ